MKPAEIDRIDRLRVSARVTEAEADALTLEHARRLLTGAASRMRRIRAVSSDRGTRARLEAVRTCLDSSESLRPSSRLALARELAEIAGRFEVRHG